MAISPDPAVPRDYILGNSNIINCCMSMQRVDFRLLAFKSVSCVVFSDAGPVAVNAVMPTRVQPSKHRHQTFI
jgi:hypothetical protein